MRVLATRGASERVAGSPAEVSLIACLRRYGVEPPVRQYPVDLGGGWKATVDLAWPHRRFFVEWDGAEAHAGHFALAYDLERQNALADAGWSFRRFSGSRVLANPAWVAGKIAAALARCPVAVEGFHTAEVGNPSTAG